MSPALENIICMENNSLDLSELQTKTEKSVELAIVSILGLGTQYLTGLCCK